MEKIELGSPEFWALYDKFCHPVNLEMLVQGKESDVITAISQIGYAAHKTGKLEALKRDERNWKLPAAWVALRRAQIFNERGDFWKFVQVGDVFVVEYGWDRDVFVTHSPITEHICGYLLSGRWDPMIGLFFPLFSEETITTVVSFRLQQNVFNTMARIKKQAGDWGWAK